MAGGYTSSRALGIPIGRRGPTAGDPPGREAPSPSLTPRRPPFVFVSTDGVEVPGLVVEQRRGDGGWEILVAAADFRPDGTWALSLRWFAAADVRSAT